jgi:hypothetical protein
MTKKKKEMKTWHITHFLYPSRRGTDSTELQWDQASEIRSTEKQISITNYRK